MMNIENETSVNREKGELLPNYPLRVIMLAGGRGTRLHSVTQGEIPKCFVYLDKSKTTRGIDYLDRLLAKTGLDPKNIVFSANDYYGQYQEKIDGKNSGYTMLRQFDDVGNGGAVEQAVNEYGLDYQYLVISPDTLFSSRDLNKIITEHKPGTISWAVNTYNEIMSPYFGLVVERNGAVIGDSKINPLPENELKNKNLYIKGAINIFDPRLYMEYFNKFKVNFGNSYPIDLYWQILPFIEKKNAERVKNRKDSIMQAVVFNDPIIDFGVPERLFYVIDNELLKTYEK